MPPQKYCYQIEQAIEDNVSQQVQQCVEQSCNWWCLCCNKWFCFLVWVVVTVVNWVLTTVCVILGDIFDLIVAIATGGWDIIVGIFTGNWSLVWDGLVEIGGAVGALLGDGIRTIVFPCGLFGAFRQSVDKWRLRGYVEGLIDNNNRFSDQDRAQIKQALGINGGGFGLRLQVQYYRGYVRSDFIAPGDTIPALVRWNNDNPDTRVDLKILAGFKWNHFFERGRPDIRGPNTSESDMDAYLADPTSRSFSIYAMSDDVQLEKIHDIQIKGDTIGLKFFEFNMQDVLLTDPTQVRAIPSGDGVVNNLANPPFNRPPFNSPDAPSVLCSPIVFGTFQFQDNGYVGYSACLRQSTCVDKNAQPPGPTGGTGAEYRDRLPDWAFQYVPIHELGHTFGLCHVDGLDRIMVSTRDHSWWSWWLLPEYLCFSGEPQFVYDEAKAVWDYIIANFPTDCLANRQSGLV